MAQNDDSVTCDTHEHTPHTHTPRPEATIVQTAAMFNALGDSARLRLMETLFDGEHCVSELAQEMGESLSTISQRLKVLYQAGLVSKRRQGRHIYYALADEHIIELLRNGFAHASGEGHHHP
ncbi:MAG: metalloregulator ArsR/SmtB family transcription factor [Myxococcota bacterium]